MAVVTKQSTFTYLASVPTSSATKSKHDNMIKFEGSWCIYLVKYLFQINPPRLFYTTTHRSLKAYCAILVKHSNFRHQASPRVSPRESTQRREGVTVGEKCPVILSKCRFTRYI